MEGAKTAGFIAFNGFKTQNQKATFRSEKERKKSCEGSSCPSVRQSRCSQIFQALIIFMTLQNKSPSSGAQPKKGLVKRRAGNLTDAFTPAYPKHVNKRVKVLFERRSFHRQRQSAVPARRQEGYWEINRCLRCVNIA